MIRIDPANTVERETNRHVENDASTMIEIDADDKLGLIDRFRSTQASITSAVSSAISNSSGSSSSAKSGGCSGGSCGCDGCGGTATSSLFKGQSKDNATSLWERLLCSSPMAIGYGSRSRSPLQMLYDALFMRLTNCAAQVLTDSLQIYGNSVQLNERAIQNRLRNALGRSKDILSEETQASASAKMGIDTKYFKSAIKIGNKIKELDRDDKSDPQETVDLINSLSENGDVAEYLDMQAEYALLDTMIDQAIASGSSDAIEVILAKLQTDDQRQELLLGRVRDAAFNSDFHTINLTLKYASSHAILARVPTIVTDILQYYIQPESDDANKDHTALSELITLLTTLDPRWDTKVRNGIAYKNLYVFSYASVDAKRLFMLNDTYRSAILLAPSFPKEDYQLIMCRYYPRMQFKTYTH